MSNKFLVLSALVILLIGGYWLIVHLNPNINTYGYIGLSFWWMVITSIVLFTANRFFSIKNNRTKSE